ncbi:hypothetical protein BLNAU_21142 [Blattamonas nauphoetae]|uniref:Uncharacterized protein n=1 Tax=Blattamonas nauphoetae TaxID=2049346 RepID=A0ABQ9WWR6_9EUKA|nr:hypothetical protein BLNAU_21142 [Blattamonas nauphoetae]
MPPKHTIATKRNKTQTNPQTKQAQSSTSNKTIINSTIPHHIKNDNKTSLDSHSIPSETEALTITDNDCQYIRISKQILQYEQKRKRINSQTMLEQAHVEGTEINLPTSSTSDWRLVLQDSITTVDIEQGCVSLFEQVDSGMNLTPIEVFHAVKFLEYAIIHIRHYDHPYNKLLETISPQEANCQTKVTSALIKLICHPSDKLRTVALSFFDAFIEYSSNQCTIAVTVTGFLPQLFEHLKPQEIPFFTETRAPLRMRLGVINNKVVMG